MKMKKIYLVSATINVFYEHSSFILDAFESKDLAEKVANGLNDVQETIIEEADSKMKEREQALKELYDNPLGYSEEEIDSQEDAIYNQYEEYEYDSWDSYSYSVEEIDLIN